MKKILIGMICDGKAGGIDKYLLNFYESVRSDDLRVDFLTNKKDPELEKRLKETGAHLYEVPSLMHPIRQYNEVKKLIQRNGYDVVYMNISTALMFPVLKAAYNCRVEKVAVHSHSSGYDCTSGIKRRMFTLLHCLCKPLVCKYAEHFYTCSDKAAKWMLTKPILQQKKYKTIFNAVDTSQFHYDEKKRDQLRREMCVENNFVVGYVGNFLYSKNLLFLIDAFYKLQKADSSAVLVMLGDGPLLKQVQTKVASYGLENKVRFLGRVDTSKGYMNAFDVLALPSHFEGLPIVSVEAQCSRLPCVLSDTISHEACISNMCRFVSNTSPDDFADALLAFKSIDRNELKLKSELDLFSVDSQDSVLKEIIQTT